MPEGNFTQKDGVTLREYIDFRVAALQETMDKSERLLNKRLEGMNEFRDALKDQNATFISREAYEAKHCLLQAQVDDLRMSKAAIDAKASAASVYVGYAIALAGIFLAILSYANSL